MTLEGSDDDAKASAVGPPPNKLERFPPISLSLSLSSSEECQKLEAKVVDDIGL